MAIRRIDNVTYHLELDDVSMTHLPNELPAIMDDGSIVYVTINSWYPSNTINTSVAGDYIFVGRVTGVPTPVLASVIIDGHEESPISVFPNEIDDFGNPKVDIQTADIPDIDDYQYFKAKYPRSVTEGMQLARLRDLLVDKVILASDINHLRNAVIEIEKFLKLLEARVEDLERRVSDLEDRMDELEARVTQLEIETVIDGENLGSGEGLFKRVRNRIMEFRSIVGEGEVDISTIGDEVVIEVPKQTGCGVDIYGQSYTVCGDKVKFGGKLEDGKLSLTPNGSFGMRMVPLKQYGDKKYNSMLMTFGVGSDQGAEGAGRMLKCIDGFIFEVKSSPNETYSGFEVRKTSIGQYEGEPSKINQEIRDTSLSVYDMGDLAILEGMLW